MLYQWTMIATSSVRHVSPSEFGKQQTHEQIELVTWKTLVCLAYILQACVNHYKFEAICQCLCDHNIQIVEIRQYLQG